MSMGWGEGREAIRENFPHPLFKVFYNQHLLKNNFFK